MSKKLRMILAALIISGMLPAVVVGQDEVVGTWDCELWVDMNYPVTLYLKSTDGQLSGNAENDYGDYVLEDIQFEQDKLTFEVNSPEAGLIGFDLKVEGSKMSGIASSDMFEGDFSCKKKE